jgi:Holliday junction resolvasome RuvABC endonuclease subunit
VTTLIAIDPSLSSTGLAVWRSGMPLHLETVAEKPWDTVHPSWVMPNRCSRISGRVSRWIEPGNTVAIIEGMIKPTAEANRGTSTLDIAQLRGVIETDLFRFNVPFTTVHPATLKAYAVKGGASKSQMVDMARVFLGAKYPIRNDNEADAFWLLAMALHRYGRPVVPQTPARARSLGSVNAWAPFRLEG